MAEYYRNTVESQHLPFGYESIRHISPKLTSISTVTKKNVCFNASTLQTVWKSLSLGSHKNP